MRTYLVILFILVAISAFAQEKILKFYSHIEVRPDRSIDVTEQITVKAEGKDIRKGIYRFIPTEVVDHIGATFR